MKLDFVAFNKSNQLSHHCYSKSIIAKKAKCYVKIRKMKYFEFKKKYIPKKSIIKYYTNAYWFIPSDVLQRSIEANIWDLCKFSHPILEIGTGNGRLTKYIFRKFKKIDVGIDNEKDGIEEARSNKIYGKILHADAAKMPFENETFRTVIANSTFEHIEHDTDAISEAARVLKKNGLLFITVPNKNLSDWILEEENKRFNKKVAKKKLVDFNKRANHLHYHTLAEWEKIFNNNKMKIVVSKYYFKKSTALFWYRLFKIFTSEFKSKEIWSYLSSEKYKKFIPEKITRAAVVRLLNTPFQQGFFTRESEGAQLFIIAKKL